VKVKRYATVAAGAAVGYVMGTRAGRERYEELKGQAAHAMRAGWHKGGQMRAARRDHKAQLTGVPELGPGRTVPATTPSPSVVDPEMD
jgi:hypothetical protein